MTPTMPFFARGRFVIATILTATTAIATIPARPMNPTASQETAARSVISFIGHETTDDRTRVILHANSPIDYRGGSLRGGQVILDLANAEVALPTPVVEMGAPEVDRVVVGPEISRDGEKVLKIRLTGVRARSHKVMARGNELHVDLEPLSGARGQEKGLPKLINNDVEIMAGGVTTPADAVVPARNVGFEEVEAIAAAPASIEPIVMEAPVARVAAASADPVPEMAPEAEEPVRIASLEPIVVPAAPAPVPVFEAPAPAAVAAPSMTVQSPAPTATAAIVPAVASGLLAAVPTGTANDQGRVLRVAAGRSLTLDTGVPFSRISVSNPAVAEPIAISSTQLLINGLTPGVVSLVLWPKAGDPILYELAVSIDTDSLSRQLETIFPGERVKVQASRDSIVLSGPISSNEIGEKMVKLAGDYSPKVMNHLSGPGASRRQVMLKVKFAEVSKTALTELGAVLHHVNPLDPRGYDRGTSGTGEFAPPSGNLLNNPVGPDFTWEDAINLSFFEKSLDLGVFITALKTRGLFQELAEPTLIAADGQEASFLAGGEFPVPIAQPGANFTAVTVEWKKFGISLDFKPTLRNDGVIVLKVKPEVSSLDFSNAVLLEGFRIPSVIVRRAETEVELRSGQAFAIAGLYDRNLLQSKSKIPVLGDIPILGYLFRSKNLQKGVTELLVIVTPTIIEPLGSAGEAKLPELEESFDLSKPKPAKN